MKTYVAILATVALAIPAHASLRDATVTVSYFVPPGTIYVSGDLYAQTAKIGDQQEFPSFGFGRNVGIDFTDDKLTIAHTIYGRTIYDVGSIVFRFVNSPPITRVLVLDRGEPIFINGSQEYLFDQSRISFSDNYISLYMAGLYVPGISVLQFSIITSPVPAPTSNWLIGLGVLGVYAATRSRQN